MNNFFIENQIITQILVAIFVPIGGGSNMHKNRNSHGLAMNCDGEKKFIFDDGKVYTVHKNDIIYLPKHSNYQVSTIVPGNTWCINYQRLSDNISSPIVLHAVSAEEILKAYQNAEHVWRRARPGREHYVLSELHKILYELQRSQGTPYSPKTKQTLIKPAIDYIYKHYIDELIDIKSLSELCDISDVYLRKLFKKIYGCSPIKYINQLKIKRAKELLASGEYSVSEAAFSSGFSDLSHFTRFFKENVGVLPSEYIKENIL